MHDNLFFSSTKGALRSLLCSAPQSVRKPRRRRGFFGIISTVAARVRQDTVYPGVLFTKRLVLMLHHSQNRLRRFYAASAARKSVWTCSYGIIAAKQLLYLDFMSFFSSLTGQPKQLTHDTMPTVLAWYHGRGQSGMGQTMPKSPFRTKPPPGASAEKNSAGRTPRPCKFRLVRGFLEKTANVNKS